MRGERQPSCKGTMSHQAGSRAATVPGMCPQDITAVRGWEETCLRVGATGRVGFQQQKWRERRSM